MTKQQQYSYVISSNMMQCLSINLLSCIFISAFFSTKPALAGDSLQFDTPRYDTETEQQATLTKNISQEFPNTSVEIQQTLKQPQEPETISQISFSTSESETPKPSQKLAQTDSSGSVGDTFGETNRLREELLIEPIITTGQSTRIIGAPSSSAGTPTAYGASWRQAFIGGGLYFPFDGNVDGSFSVGFGLGNAAKTAGLEVSFNILSVGGQEPNLGDFGDSGTIGLKLHRYLTNNTAVAVGWSNAIKWGEADNNQETIYGVVTQRFDKLTVSAGLGSGSYRSKGARDAGDNDANFFGSLGYRFIPQASLISSWTGRAWNVGASFAPFKETPIVINTIFTDVTDNVNSAGFSVTAGYSIQF